MSGSKKITVTTDRKKGIPGIIKSPSNGQPYFHYFDGFGDGRKMHVWVEGTRFYIGDFTKENRRKYSIEGELEE